MPPEYKNRSAEEIVSAEYVSDSAWEIHAALSWCNFAERNRTPTGLRYAGLHLRTGIEHLWFEVLFAAQGGTLSLDEYTKALKQTTTLYKLIDSKGPHYRKFAEFTQIMGSLDGGHPPTVIWDLDRLKRIHGMCGGLLLHFQGVPRQGYLNEAWIAKRTKFLFDSASWIATVLISPSAAAW